MISMKYTCHKMGNYTSLSVTRVCVHYFLVVNKNVLVFFLCRLLISFFFVVVVFTVSIQTDQYSDLKYLHMWSYWGL